MAFVLILTGSPLQWPTLLPLSIFPILLLMHGSLALTEEHEVRERFGPLHAANEQNTPRIIPKLRAPRRDVVER